MHDEANEARTNVQPPESYRSIFVLSPLDR